LEEINRAILDLEEAETQRRALEQQEEPQHVPRPPVGEVPPGAISSIPSGNVGEDVVEERPRLPRINPRALAPMSVVRPARANNQEDEE